MSWPSPWFPLILSAGDPEDSLLPISIRLSSLISSTALVLVIGIAAFLLEFIRNIGCKHSLERSPASDAFFEDPNSVKKELYFVNFYATKINPNWRTQWRVKHICYLEQHAATDKTFTYENVEAEIVQSDLSDKWNQSTIHPYFMSWGADQNVDDGSKDWTSKVAFDFVRKYLIDTVRVILLGRNHGKETL